MCSMVFAPSKKLCCRTNEVYRIKLYNGSQYFNKTILVFVFFVFFTIVSILKHGKCQSFVETKCFLLSLLFLCLFFFVLAASMFNTTYFTVLFVRSLFYVDPQTFAVLYCTFLFYMLFVENKTQNNSIDVTQVKCNINAYTIFPFHSKNIHHNKTISLKITNIGNAFKLKGKRHPFFLSFTEA